VGGRVTARFRAEDLSKRLRSGELDDRLDELIPKLAEHIRRKLEIARPDYGGDAG
jgi:hypothetical protein